MTTSRKVSWALFVTAIPAAATIVTVVGQEQLAGVFGVGLGLMACWFIYGKGGLL